MGRLRQLLVRRGLPVLRRLLASPGASGPPPASAPDGAVRAERPYETVLNDAGREGRALHRENLYGSGPPNDHPNPMVFEILMAWAGPSTLDVGCGIGAYTAALLERGVRAEGIELNTDHVARARALGRPVREYDGLHIPFADRSFHCAAAIEVLEHVPEWEQLLREMVRVADRTVLISVPNIGVLPGMARHLVGPWHLLEATHVNFFTSEILRTYLTAAYPDWRCEVSEYGFFQVNGETFTNHVLAVLTR